MSGTAGSPARLERRLLLIRHGQTEFNKAGRMQGQLDTPLSDAGRDEAIRVAEGLADWPIGTVVSSDLERAVDTAAALAGALFAEARQFTTDPRLRETDLGEWSGRAHEDVDASFPRARSHWRLHPRGG
ncbi:MAG TPA: histidine phosphatase family protein, partial [Corynebacterium variabile]|nr:histidine phosphatase family protein [Corynebacterium variabile]